jgi:hypothetical protein
MQDLGDFHRCAQVVGYAGLAPSGRCHFLLECSITSFLRSA